MNTRIKIKCGAQGRASLPTRPGSANLVERAYYTQSRTKRDGYWSQWNSDSPHFKRLRQSESHWKNRREHLKSKTEKWWPPEQSRLVYGIFDYRHGLPYKLTRRILRRCHSPKMKDERPGARDATIETGAMPGIGSSELLGWLRVKLAGAEKELRAREQSVAMFLRGKPMNKEARLEVARIQDRCAAKSRREVEMFKAVIAALAHPNDKLFRLKSN